MDLLVSVVIPTHNRRELLLRAIQSVQKQTINHLEIIVVSDGSTDGTNELVNELMTKDSRIKFISYSPSRNGNYARNQGIMASQGEYIAFLDDDDEWLPSKIEKQVHLMESDNEIGLVYTGTHSIYVDNKIEYDSFPSLQGDMRKQILYNNMVGSTTTVMLRRDVLSKSGLFDEKLPAMQDYDLWIRVCQYSKVGVLSESLVNYYNYNDSGQISLDYNKYEKAYDVVNRKYEILFKQLTQKEWKRKIAGQKLFIGNKAHRCGNGLMARYYYKQSLRVFFQLKTIFFYIMSYWDYSILLKLRSYK